MSTDSQSEANEQEHSSGGVLVQQFEGENLVCLVQIPTRGGNPSWRLPKGSIEDGETSREAAIRETREETGCNGEILSELSGVEYWYTRRADDGSGRVRVRKVVDFFLMKYTGGDVADHDHEVDEAKWFTFSKALSTISYDAERRVLQEAIHAWDAHLYRQGFDEEEGLNSGL
jgi:8-oxo-dGTP pyrophosphatase MutT (NUDIX family)